MASKKILTNGNAFRRTDNRWGGVVWYRDEQGERKRKSFSGTTKQEVNRKMTDYIANFEKEVNENTEARKPLRESMQKWLEIFKFPSIERTTYDRYECTAKNQIYSLLGDKIVENITAADIKQLLNHWMQKGLAWTTVKKVYIILGEYFKYLLQQEIIQKNPMNSAPMIKKSNFMTAQNKEDLPVNESITVFTAEEIERMKSEAFNPYTICAVLLMSLEHYSIQTRFKQSAIAILM